MSESAKKRELGEGCGCHWWVRGKKYSLFCLWRPFVARGGRFVLNAGRFGAEWRPPWGWANGTNRVYEQALRRAARKTRAFPRGVKPLWCLVVRQKHGAR